jgi:hypothetical protein
MCTPFVLFKYIFKYSYGTHDVYSLCPFLKYVFKYRYGTHASQNFLGLTRFIKNISNIFISK